jgi:hypothetical protein
MSTDPMTLADIQRAMAAAVMMPLNSDESMRSHAPDGRGMEQVAASFVAPNSRLTPFERLEIYNKQYWLRILGSLAEDFPALRAVVGTRRFEALSIAYFTAHPSRSFTLRNLGSKLVEWLLAHPEYAGRRHALAVDVARIEWAFVEAFDSAERTPLTLDQIATLDANSRLALQPHVQLMALDYPADDLVVALHSSEKRQTSEAGVQHEEEDDATVRLPEIRRRPTWLSAHRLEHNVYYRRLAREEYATLCALRDGQPLNAALEAGFAGSRMSAARRAQAVQQWFAAWAELAWVTAPDLESLVKS